MAPRIGGPSQPLQPLQASSEIMVISQPTNPPLVPVSLPPAPWETPFVIHPLPLCTWKAGSSPPQCCPLLPLQVQVGLVNAVEQVLFLKTSPQLLLPLLSLKSLEPRVFCMGVFLSQSAWATVTKYSTWEASTPNFSFSQFWGLRV